MLPDFGNHLTTLAAFLATVGIVVVVHEFGHYLIARINGIGVRVFSIGFGREVISWRDRNRTVWRIGLIPLGGYVAFHEPKPNSEQFSAANKMSRSSGKPDGTFSNASLRSRSTTVLAGPAANFLLSIAIFAVVAGITGFPENSAEIASLKPLPKPSQLQFAEADKIVAVNGYPIHDLSSLYLYASEADPSEPSVYLVEREDTLIEIEGPFPTPPIMEEVRPVSPAFDAGLVPGDVVLSVDGASIASFLEFRDIVSASEGQPLTLSVWRDGETLNITLAARYEDVPAAGGGFEKRLIVGVASGLFFDPASYFPTPFEAIWLGLVQTFSIIVLSVDGLANIAFGKISVCNIQGPVGIAKLSGAVASQGTIEFLRLIGILSTIIGFMNLLPIPLLDGGHLVFLAYEAATRKPPGERTKRIATQVGLLVVVALLCLGLLNDFTCF